MQESVCRSCWRIWYGQESSVMDGTHPDGKYRLFWSPVNLLKIHGFRYKRRNDGKSRFRKTDHENFIQDVIADRVEGIAAINEDRKMRNIARALNDEEIMNKILENGYPDSWINGCGEQKLLSLFVSNRVQKCWQSMFNRVHCIFVTLCVKE